MTEAQVKNIFDENNLESSFGTEKERGTGLGLRISKELIEKQNGHIFVESILAQGSKFTITIPIA
jgi:signal transduction histidine kinase